MKHHILKILVLSSCLFFAFIPPVDDEGMFPLSEISNLDLAGAGLKIPVSEVYNPDGVSLIDALVKVGGCTGSFVSSEGLILTNHHCSFDAVQKASTTTQNYLEDGFLASERKDEIPASGLSCRITESYEDVSSRILEAAADVQNVAGRTTAIQNEIRKIISEEEKKNPGIKADVSEMFIGKTYVLFRYRTINDVRLVYVPPRAIGEFGGETDNWMWPRHTGDFSFLRAYVAPDGSSAAYSEDNVPFKPKKFIQVNPEGADENDFVFILGYPGKTFKHQPSQFLEHQVGYQLPYIQSMYEWLIKLYEEKGETNAEFALEISPKIKSLANTEKNYRSKLRGVERLQLIKQRKDQEKELQIYINSSDALKQKYGSVLGEIEKVYAEIFESGRREYVYSMLRNVKLYRLAELMLEYKDDQNKPDEMRKSINRDNNLNAFYTQVNSLYSEYYSDLDKKILAKIISDVQKFPEVSDKEPFLAEGFTSEEEFAETLIEQTIVKEHDEYLDLLDSSPEEIIKMNDPLIEFARQVYQVRLKDEKRSKDRQSRLNILLAQYVNAKQEMLNKSFIPDANSTLRLSYGYVKGYSPSDATYYSPQTSLKGLIDKGKSSGDFQLPQVVRKLYDEKDFGKFVDPELETVPVALLYSTDTTGGNSGSPVLDAYGKLIALNFDRVFEATINDYAWSEDYSRSIGVDIRFILWFTQKAGGADFLLKEMGVF